MFYVVLVGTMKENQGIHGYDEHLFENYNEAEHRAELLNERKSNCLSWIVVS